ncbi:Permease of the drug/metabolite transporter (DMT) superfamily [Clostridium sp. DSM 8431]|uniref:DMT family transporter n=1 Tax=Clostridium sp. DSM 8431 TaxID=1761781 RepID=UPI0008EF11C0|nr:DMT family transporter [Clostridium sp. DSM 8431]SFU33158.1 Permease of the drug/metabolite transporter (DMT) superfamily [Clostridium sp. DSM 8431]
MEKSKNYFTKSRNILIMAVLCTMLWGSAYPSVKTGYKLFEIAGNVEGQMLFAGIRFAFAGILTIIAACFMNKKFVRPNKSNIKGITVLGLIQTTIQYIFYYIGMSNTTGVKASILNAISPFIVIILCHFLTKDDKINSKKAIGCILGFLGVVILNLGASKGINSGFSFMGEGFIILAATSFSVGSIYSKRIAHTGDAAVITGYQLLLGGLILILISFIKGVPHLTITPLGIILLVYMAFLSAIAFTVWTILLKYNSAGRISIYNFLTPIFGALMSALFLGEVFFNLKNIIALICVCTGIYIINRPDNR